MPETNWMGYDRIPEKCMFTVCVVNNMQWHDSFPIPERTGTNAQQMDGRNEGRWNLWHVVKRYMGWEMIKKLKVKSHQLSVDWSLKASNKFCCACREATSQTTGCDVIVMKRPKLYDSKKSFRTSINRTMSAWLVYRDSFRALPWSSAIYQNCLIAAHCLRLKLMQLSICFAWVYAIFFLFSVNFSSHFICAVEGCRHGNRHVNLRALLLLLLI